MDIQDLLQQFLPDVLGNQQQGVGQPAPGVPMPPPRPPQATQPQQVPLPPPKPPQIQGQTGAQVGQEVPIDPALLAAGQGGGMPSFQGGPMPQPPPPPPPQAGVPLPPPRPPSAPQMAPVPLPPPRPNNGMPGPSNGLPPNGGLDPRMDRPGMHFGPYPAPAPLGPQAGLPPNAQPTAGAGGPAAPPGPPLSLAPPQGGPPAPPPFAQQRGPGPYPETLPIDKTRQAMAGIGQGLANIQGPGRFASFARGFGQSTVGAEKNQQEQTKENQSAQGQHFNQLSTSFKDMMAAQQTNNMQAYRDAQAKYLSARADALTSGAGGGSKAWQNTPYGRVLQIEKQVNSEKERATKVLQEQWKQNGTPQDQQNAQLQALDQKYEARRGQLYKATGVDPQQADKIKSMGTSKDNPFDARTMSADQFHSQVPEGAFFINKDGKVYQRNAPPPGQQRSDLAPNADDQMAMGGQERTPERVPAG